MDINNKVLTIENIGHALLNNDLKKASELLIDNYPFSKFDVFHRNYSLPQKMRIFLRDKFIDRYSGEKLVIPGFLKVISTYLPQDFPYHKNGKMTEGHIAYWELFPSIDHVVPIATGGIDNESNWVTTSMLNNAVKSNWTLEQMRWTLYPVDENSGWDGLVSLFLEIVNANRNLLEDSYIKNWYDATLRIIGSQFKMCSQN